MDLSYLTDLDPARFNLRPGQETMKAVVTTGNGDYDKLDYRDVPVPQPGPGEVLLKVLAAGVNNTEINTRLGWYSASVDTTDWRRGRAAYNTTAQDRSAESRARAQQQAYENRERGTAGMTNQWSESSRNRRADDAQRSANTAAALGGITSFLGTVAGGNNRDRERQ